MQDTRYRFDSINLIFCADNLVELQLSLLEGFDEDKEAEHFVLIHHP